MIDGERDPQIRADLPAGFAPSQRTSPLLDLLGPIAVAERDGTLVVGMRARPDHLNNRGAVHGAVLSALADIVMGRSAVRAADPPASMVTVTLTVDFVSAAREGEWLEASATVQRAGRRLAFVQGRLHADGRLVGQCSATFAVGDLTGDGESAKRH